MISLCMCNCLACRNKHKQIKTIIYSDLETDIYQLGSGGCGHLGMRTILVRRCKHELISDHVITENADVH